MEERRVCTACNKDSLVKTRVRRMNGFLVVVGFILLVPSVFGFLAGGVMTLASGLLASQAKRPPEEVRAELHDLKVPDATIDHLFAGKLDPVEDTKDLNPEQQKALMKAQLAIFGASIEKKNVSTSDLVGGSLVVVAVSLAGGIVGWLLIRKKWVLQCQECLAVQPTA